MIRVTIGGDICPTRANMTCFVAGGADAVFHDLMDDFLKADLLVVNLECDKMLELLLNLGEE